MRFAYEESTREFAYPPLVQNLHVSILLFWSFVTGEAVERNFFLLTL